MLDRLLNNPWAQAPLPIDWEIHPTYPRRTVPYYLAPLWDVNVATKKLDEKKKRGIVPQDQNVQNRTNSNIPKELKGKLKKTEAAKGLLQDLEEQIRRFVQNWEEKTKATDPEEPNLIDSEDEEIVFVGRNGQMKDVPPSPSSKRTTSNEAPKHQLIFDSPANDHGASFGYGSYSEGQACC